VKSKYHTIASIFLTSSEWEEERHFIYLFFIVDKPKNKTTNSMSFEINYATYKMKIEIAWL
jgi:hypothetical protein